MKTLLKILLLLIIPFSFITTISYAENLTPEENSGTNRNVLIDQIKDDDFFDISGNGGEVGIYYILVRVAKDLKNLFFVLATLYLMIIVIKILFTDNTEEEVEKFKKGIIWITVGIVVMQGAYAFVQALYNNNMVVGEATGFSFIKNIINPIIGLLEVFASIFFLAIAIYSFYKLATANGDEEKVKTGRTSIIYAIVGFILIKLPQIIVEGVYGEINDSCDVETFWGGTSCIDDANFSGLAQTMLNILNWMNSFIGLIVIILIIYTGSQVLLSGGDEEKLKKAKTSIVYIAIGLVILAINYFILTFFLLPEGTI